MLFAAKPSRWRRFHASSTLLAFLVICAATLGGPLVAAASGTCAASSVMSFEQYYSFRPAWPYEVRLRWPGGELTYLGVDHTFDPEADTVVHARDSFRTIRPTVVLVEGLPEAQQATLVESVHAFGEAGALSFLARQSQVPAKSLDLPFRNEFELVARKFSGEMAALFYAMQVTFQQARRFPSLDKRAFMESTALPWLLRRTAWTGKLDSSHFERLYAQRSGGGRLFEDVSADWFMPGQPRNVFQEITTYSTELRDQEMIRLLYQEAKHGGRVLAVAGGSHVVMQEGALRRLLRCPAHAISGGTLLSPAVSDCAGPADESFDSCKR